MIYWRNDKTYTSRQCKIFEHCNNWILYKHKLTFYMPRAISEDEIWTTLQARQN